MKLNTVVSYTSKLTSLPSIKISRYFRVSNECWVEKTKFLKSQLKIILQIQDGKGDVTITNDGATILKQMQVLHPAARMVSIILDEVFCFLGIWFDIW